MAFGDFLEALFPALEAERVRYCVLRNYERFPDINLGSDIDFLIDPCALPRAIRALRSIEGTRIVGFTERPYLAMVFLAGISRGTASRALEIDFDLSLSWKGMSYLANDAVLQAVRIRQAGSVRFFVPAPEHEAIISLLTSLLLFGRIKERYFPQVQQTFQEYGAQVSAALEPRLGSDAARRLVDAVVCGDFDQLRQSVQWLRTTLALRSFLDGPIRTATGIVRHHQTEFALRYSPGTLERVCLLAQRGHSKTAVVELVLPMLASTANIVERVSCGTAQGVRKKGRGTGLNSEPNSEPASCARGHDPLIRQIVLQLAREWAGWFAAKRNLTLQVSDNGVHQLLINTQQSPSRFSRWLMPILSWLAPPVDLWLLLESRATPGGGVDWPAQVSSSRSWEPHRLERDRANWVVLDANGPDRSVAEKVHSAIIDMLAARTDALLKRRFQQGKTGH